MEFSHAFPVAIIDEDYEGKSAAYLLTFQELFNRFPGFNYEVQGVFQERVDGHIKFHTYVVRE
jgi:arginine/lysine/ornithine decarboxylase